MMPVITNQPDGLHLAAHTTLTQLTAETALQNFADAILVKAIANLPQLEPTLLTALFEPDPTYHPLLTALLILDAEIKTMVDDKTHHLPLPAFLSYRHRLPTEQLTFETIRLPPLNPDGHYQLIISEAGSSLAARLDIHPISRVAGHIRLAVSGPGRSPARLVAAENRLTWQHLSAGLIEEAVSLGSAALPEPLTDTERQALIALLTNEP